MKTVDKFLLELQNKNYLDQINLRDRRILVSLGNQLKSGNFLTENQAKLLIKILNENKTILGSIDNTIEEILTLSLWSKPFRLIEKVRKISLGTKDPSFFHIEFTFNKAIKSAITNLLSSQKIERVQHTGKIISIPLTELNLYHVLTTLKKYNFQIDQTLINFYNDIDRIIKNPEIYKLNYKENKSLVTAIEKDLTSDFIDDQILITDRRIRYQFDVDYNLDSSLTSLIAARKKNKIWIENQKQELSNICLSLLDLHRFPVLFVLDKHNPEQTFLNLQLIYQVMKNLNKTLNVYFRLNNNTGKNFNNFISDYKLNGFLNKHTDSIILDNSHLPKFLFRTDWKPASVISFTNNLRNNKLSAYSNFVDLIVYYTSTQPIISDTDAIM